MIKVQQWHCTSTIDYLFEDDPLVNKFISVPKEQSNFNCAAFMAGVVEAFLCGVQFVGTISKLVLIHNNNY